MILQYVILVIIITSLVLDANATLPLPFSAIKNHGASYTDVICSGELVLVFKTNGNIPICISPISLEILLERDWVKLEYGNITLADTVLYNGIIYTFDELPFQSLAITDGIITFIGDDDDVMSLIDNFTEVIDLDGKLVLPGFHDSHLHLLESASLIDMCIIDSQDDIDGIINSLTECNPELINEDWIVGYGHSISSLFGNTKSPLIILDDIFPNNPAIIMETTSHSHWVNSLALQKIMNNDTLTTSSGGFMGFIQNTTIPNGILYDNLGDVVMSIALASSLQTDNANYAGISSGMNMLASNGITSITEARVFLDRNHHKLWQTAGSDDILTGNVVLALYAYPHLDDSAQINHLASLYNDSSNPRLTQIKMYVDGEFSHGTSKLINAYSNDTNFTSTFGINYFDEQRLTKYITTLEKIGFDFHLHASGDRAVRDALNAIENARKINGDVGARHKITHITLYHPDDVNRFADLGVVADFQTSGFFALPDFEYEMIPLIGVDRLPYFSNPRSIHDTGAVTTLSSDWSVGSLDPFVGIENALSKNHKSMPDLDSAIRAYTINAAYSMRQDDTTGSLDVGKYADLLVLDVNIFDVPVSEISKTRVLFSMFQGDVIFVDDSWR